MAFVSFHFQGASHGRSQTTTQRLIEELANRFNTKRFDAHATLIGLLDYSEKEESLLCSGLNELSRTLGEYSVHGEATGVGMRNMHLQSVFCPLVPSPQLKLLNDKARIIFKHQDDPPYMPHLSMVYGDLGYKVKQMIDCEIKTLLPFPLNLTFDRLVLVKVDGHPDEWKIVKELAFAT